MYNLDGTKATLKACIAKGRVKLKVKTFITANEAWLKNE